MSYRILRARIDACAAGDALRYIDAVRLLLLVNDQYLHRACLGAFGGTCTFFKVHRPREIIVRI